VECSPPSRHFWGRMITFNCFMTVQKDDGTTEVCVVTSGDFCHMAGRRNPRLAAFREVVGREPKDEASLPSACD